MNYTILFNLEKKPLTKIEIYFDSDTSVSEIKEIDKNNYENILEIKQFDNEEEFEKYLDKVKEVYSAKGFTDSYRMIDNINNLEFIEDDLFGYLIKEPNYSSNLQTTKYLESFKITASLSLGTDENFNLFNDIKDTYRFFIDNQIDIIESLKEWFWADFLEQFNNDIELEESHRIGCNFDRNYDELVKLKIEDRNYKYIYDEAKEKSDKFFHILKAINEVKTLDDKINILDEIILIRSITFDNNNDEDNIYGDIIFYFDYFLDDEHGLQIKLENGKNFELY